MAASLLLLAIVIAAIMPHAQQSSKHEGDANAQSAITFSAKRNGGIRKDASTPSLRA
jgi:hypothetical protein